jgi:L-alanine-DL-glutamate epimerase-like enolase superfamily enzyme
MVTLFALHMMGAIDNAGSYVEFSIEPTPWAENIFQPALQVKDGKVWIPDQPGWGVEIESQWLSSAQYQISELG